MAKVGNAIIGALRVILSADTVTFETALKGAEKSVGNFARSIKGPLALAAAAFSAAFVGVSIAVKGALNQADELSKASQKFGVPIEQLSALKYAADLADVSLETLGGGLRKLSQAMAKEDEIFKALGVSIKSADGTLRSVQDVFIDVAEALSNMNEGAAKTAATIRIFGKSGTELLPLLNEGAAGLKRLTDEAAELGLVIDAKTGKAAEAFNDNLTRLQRTFTGIYIQIAAQLAPSLATLTNRIVEFAKSTNLAKGAADFLKASMKFVNQQLIMVSGALEKLNRLSQAFSEIWTIVADDVIEGDFAKIGEAFTRMRSDLQSINTKTAQELEKLRLDDILNPNLGTIEVNVDTKDAQTELNVLNTLAKDTKDELEDVITKFVPEGYEELVRKGNEEVQRTEQLWDSIGNTMENGAKSVLDDLIQGTLTWKSALSNVLNIASQILANIGSSAISGVGGWGSILQSLPGFATGGSFRVGGTGGIDSQLVSFWATPNEPVMVGDDAMSGHGSTNYITVGAGVSRAEIEMALDARDAQIARNFSGAMKVGRVRGKF